MNAAVDNRTPGAIDRMAAQRVAQLEADVARLTAAATAYRDYLRKLQPLLRRRGEYDANFEIDELIYAHGPPVALKR